jgi:hypothetical protein
MPAMSQFVTDFSMDCFKGKFRGATVQPNRKAFPIVRSHQFRKKKIHMLVDGIEPMTDVTNTNQDHQPLFFNMET